jgi:hypothetical protein
MKLDIGEVFFIKESMKTVTIKAIDSPMVAKLITKIDKEFDRLKKLEETKT